MRIAAVVLLSCALPGRAECEELRPLVEKFHGKEVDPWLARLRAPRLDAAAKNVYGGPENDVIGRNFARWIAGMQAGDESQAKRAWAALSAGKDWRAGLAEHLRRAWPRSGWADGDRDRAFACLDAIAIVGGDEFHAKFAARRRAYIEACTKEIPNPPDAKLPPDRQARIWIEGLRRMGPVWSCFAGAPPFFHGEPDAYLALLPLLPDAYPDLVIACSDERPAGRSMSVGGHGERCSVAFVAKWRLRTTARIAESEFVLERWIRSGAWRDRERTETWLLEHARSAFTLVPRVLRLPPESARRFLESDDPATRVAAAAVLKTLPALRTGAPSAVREPGDDVYAEDSPISLALRAWTEAVSGHGADGRKLLAGELAKATVDLRIALMSSLLWLRADAALVPVCAPYVERDQDDFLRLAAARTLHHHSGEAFAEPTAESNERLPDAALRWLKSRR